jgi:hypothetical protein
LDLTVIDQRLGRASLQSATLGKPFGSIALKGRLPLVVWLYLIAVVVPIGFNAGPLALTGLRLLLIVMIIPLMVQLLSGRFGKVLLIDILFILHIIWATIAMLVINPEMAIENTGAAAIEFLGGYVVGRAYIRTPEAFGALCKALGTIVLISLPFALIETTTGRPLLVEAIRKIPGAFTVPMNFQEPRMGLERVQFGFAHPIHYGLFCAVAFSMAWVGLEGWTTAFRRILTSTAIATCGFLALSSGALLAIFLQIGLIAWAMAFASVKQRWWLLTGLFALAYVVIDLFSNRSPILVFLSYATFSAHTAYWRTIIFDWGVSNVIGSVERGIPASPWFGIGLNDWVRPSFMHSGSMDNFWLVIAVRYGIPALLFLAAGYIIGLARIMRRDFTGDQILLRFRRAWVFTFFGLTFTLCTVFVWTSIYSFVFFFFGAGMWLIMAQPRPQAEVAPDTAPDAAAARPRSPYSRFPQKSAVQIAPKPMTASKGQ